MDEEGILEVCGDEKKTWCGKRRTWMGEAKLAQYWVEEMAKVWHACKCMWMDDTMMKWQKWDRGCFRRGAAVTDIKKGVARVF